MKKFKERCGAALLEIVVSIALLGILMVPISSGIVMSFRINAKSDDVMQARLAVASAVETLMAHGVEAYNNDQTSYDFTDLEVSISDTVGAVVNNYWTVTVSSETVEGISVTTNIRKAGVRTP